MGSGCVDDLGTSWRWVVSFTPLPPYPPGKSPRYPFYRRLGGPQSRSGRYGEVNIFDPTGTRNSRPPGRPARSQSLYRLGYPGSRIMLKLISVQFKYSVPSHRKVKILEQTLFRFSIKQFPFSIGYVTVVFILYYCNQRCFTENRRFCLIHFTL
jgi:hypothetical protein